MVKINKVEETEQTLKMDKSSDTSPDNNNTNKYCNQGVKPKVKNHFLHKENKSGGAIQNGSASQSEKISSAHNGASCSSSISSYSSFCHLNQVLGNSSEKNNLDHLAEKCSAKGRTLSAEDNDLRYHDKKRKTGSFMDNENSSGNEGDEGLSGDDCCIYTYKGDQFADLPNSFFPVDVQGNEGDQPQRVNSRREPQPEENERSNPGSSPEMDYLEMDFDPGPSLDLDSEEDVGGFERKPNNYSLVPELPNDEVVDSENEIELNSVEKMETCQDSQEPQPGPSSYQWSPKINSNKLSNCDTSNNFTKERDDAVRELRFSLESCCSNSCCADGEVRNLSEGIKRETNLNVASSFNFQLFAGERLDKKTLSIKNNDVNGSRDSENELDLKTPFDGVMLWTEQEAILKQVSLVSPDISCGATAVINAMLALKMRFSMEKVKEGISTRLKSDSASIPQYLVFRSFDGVVHENLIRGIHHASHGALYARFFHLYPRRNVVLSRWLSHWMKKGAVPISTMNVQRDAVPEDGALDTRHHQMIFGVSSKGIFLTDPLECVQEEELWCRLISSSVLKIKRNEIVSRWSPGTNLKPLMYQSDERWKKMNVLGQVVNIIRESPDQGAQGNFLTPYISIPASSGITLVIPRDSEGYEELVSTADLPLLADAKSE